MGGKSSRIHSAQTEEGDASRQHVRLGNQSEVVPPPPPQPPSPPTVVRHRSSNTQHQSRCRSPDYELHVPTSIPMAPPPPLQHSDEDRRPSAASASSARVSHPKLVIACPPHVSPANSSLSTPSRTSSSKSPRVAVTLTPQQQPQFLAAVNPLTPLSSSDRRRHTQLVVPTPGAESFASSFTQQSFPHSPFASYSVPVSPSAVSVSAVQYHQRLSPITTTTATAASAPDGQPVVATTGLLTMSLSQPATPLTPSRRRDSSAIAFLPVAVRLNDSMDQEEEEEAASRNGSEGRVDASHRKQAQQPTSASGMTYVRNVYHHPPALSLSLIAVASSDEFDSPHGGSKTNLYSAGGGGAMTDVLAYAHSIGGAGGGSGSATAIRGGDMGMNSSFGSSTSATTVLSLSSNTRYTMESLTHVGAPHRAQLARRATSYNHASTNNNNSNNNAAIERRLQQLQAQSTSVSPRVGVVAASPSPKMSLLPVEVEFHTLPEVVS